MSETTFEQEYLAEMVKPLMAFPDDVVVTRTVDERGVLLTLKVNNEDMGKVIGQKGMTAHAIRRLLRQYGMGNGMHLSMRLEEPPGSTFRADKLNKMNLNLE